MYVRVDSSFLIFHQLTRKFSRGEHLRACFNVKTNVLLGTEQDSVNVFSLRKEHQQLLTVVYVGRSTPLSRRVWGSCAQGVKLESFVKAVYQKPQSALEVEDALQLQDSRVPARRQVSTGA